MKPAPKKAPFSHRVKRRFPVVILLAAFGVAGSLFYYFNYISYKPTGDALFDSMAPVWIDLVRSDRPFKPFGDVKKSALKPWKLYLLDILRQAHYKLTDKYSNEETGCLVTELYSDHSDDYRYWEVVHNSLRYAQIVDSRLQNPILEDLENEPNGISSFRLIRMRARHSLDDIIPALYSRAIAMDPDMSFYYYRMAYYYSLKDDKTHMISFIKKGNEAKHNAAPELFPSGYVVDNPGKFRSLQGSEAALGALSTEPELVDDSMTYCVQQVIEYVKETGDVGAADDAMLMLRRTASMEYDCPIRFMRIWICDDIICRGISEYCLELTKDQKKELSKYLDRVQKINHEYSEFTSEGGFRGDKRFDKSLTTKLHAFSHMKEIRMKYANLEPPDFSRMLEEGAKLRVSSTEDETDDSAE